MSIQNNISQSGIIWFTHPEAPQEIPWAAEVKIHLIGKPNHETVGASGKTKGPDR